MSTWAVKHLAEHQSVLGHADLLAASFIREPGAVTVEAAERAITASERDDSPLATTGLDHGRNWSTDMALARESETIVLSRAGQGSEKTVMRRWMAETKLHRGRLDEAQKEAVKAILAYRDLWGRRGLCRNPESGITEMVLVTAVRSRTDKCAGSCQDTGARWR